MPVSMVLYSQWVPISFAARTVRHVIGNFIALVAFSFLFKLTEELVPENLSWIKGWLHWIEIFILLYLILVCAIQILVPITRDTIAVLKGKDDEN